MEEHPSLWTEAQMEALEKARHEVSSKRGNYWVLVAGQVPGKDADACKKQVKEMDSVAKAAATAKAYANTAITNHRPSRSKTRV